VHKVITFLKKGRDGWRDKYKKVKTKLRSTENQLWAVSKSREMWRERAEAAEAELKSKKKLRNSKLPEKASAVN
jgi:hypothetical protein